LQLCRLVTSFTHHLQLSTFSISTDTNNPSSNYCLFVVCLSEKACDLEESCNVLLLFTNQVYLVHSNFMSTWKPISRSACCMNSVLCIKLRLITVLLTWYKLDYCLNRTFRKWWRGLSEESRAYWKSRLAEKRMLFIAGSSILVFGGLVHYFTHINETPVTHRRRYLAFTRKQFMELAEYEYTVVNFVILHCTLLLKVACSIVPISSLFYCIVDCGYTFAYSP
jgi:hypothetical protein